MGLDAFQVEFLDKAIFSILSITILFYFIVSVFESKVFKSVECFSIVYLLVGCIACFGLSLFHALNKCFLRFDIIVIVCLGIWVGDAKDTLFARSIWSQSSKNQWLSYVLHCIYDRHSSPSSTVHIWGNFSKLLNTFVTPNGNS